MKLLLVRLRPLGDVVFTTPLVRAIRDRFPEASLTYVVEPLSAPVVQANPLLDEVIVAEKRSGLARTRHDLALGLALRRRHFDVAIDLHGGPRAAWLTWLSGARRRIGYAIPGRAWMYTDRVARPPGLQPRHSVRNQWDLLVPLGIPPVEPGSHPLEMPEAPGATAAVAGRLATHGLVPGDELLLVHVSASNPFKRWPAERFVDLIAGALRGHPRRHAAVISGPSEADAAARVASGAADALAEPRARVWAEDVTLDELRALAARASVYIGGDSGPLHVAATTGTPIVALLGPTLAERSMPWRDARWYAEAVDAGPLPCRPCHQRTCEPGDFRCLSRIDTARVLAAVERGLAAARCTDAGGAAGDGTYRQEGPEP